MALIIDATVGGDNSNSYVTLDEANTYFDSRLNVDNWTSAANDDVRNRALVQATRRLDYETYYGDIVTNTQALEFPRINIGKVNGRDQDNIIPKAIKEATYELAIHMLNTDMSQIGDDVSGLKKYSVTVGSIQETKEYLTDDYTNATDYNELPPFVESLLEPFSQTVSSGGWSEISR